MLQRLAIRAVVAGFMWACGALLVPVLPAHAADLVPTYNGTLKVAVDLTDAPKRIYRVTETIPVVAGALTLAYPKWIPGEHAPSGPMENVTGLVIKTGGQVLPWRRDTTDLFALHVTVPAGASELDLGFQFLSPGSGGMFGGSVSATRDLVALEFNQVAFYPLGFDTHGITIEPTVTLPAGWQFATAMQTVAQNGATTRFAPLSFADFVDSPLIAGRWFKRVDLAPGAKVPVHLAIVADAADDLALTEQQIKQHRALVTQTQALFGGQHFDHYEFLLTLSDATGHFGLEHHQSSDDRLMADFFTDDQAYLRAASLMPHEFVHSWNGKFRRPADLTTRDFATPMRTDLLWVYEGLTDYWAGVLTTRSGLWTAADYRDAIAATASGMALRTGRQWRSLQDTATAVPLMGWAGGWSNWRRRADYYPEGQLLWLDVDAHIRAVSHGRRSLDDFARAFYAVDGASRAVHTYTFDDVVATLNAVQPADWATFLRARLDATGKDLPEHGLARSGWKLVYTDAPSAYTKAGGTIREGLDLATSLGFTLNGTGNVTDVQWGGLAFTAGMVPGMQVVAVNDRDYSSDVLKTAIGSAAKDAKARIKLLLKYDGAYSTVSLDYHGGLRYPHLERIQGTPDRLAAILAPRKP